MRTFVYCWRGGCGLNEVHVATGIPKWRLLTWPPPDELGPPVDRSNRLGNEPEPMPSQPSIEGAASRLLASPAYDDLLAGGLWPETIARHELGLYSRSERELVGFPVGPPRRRRGIVFRATDQSEPPYVHLTGWHSTFYPTMPRWRTFVLTAGMRKPLVASQYPMPDGRPLPIVTTTTGISLPKHLLPHLAGKRVALLYDIGEDAAAERNAAKLRVIECEAWVVHLSEAELDLPDKGDLNDYFKAGGTTAELVDLISRERRAR